MNAPIPPQLLVEFPPRVASEPCSDGEHQEAHRNIKRAIDILNSAKNAFVSYAIAVENWEWNSNNPRVKCVHADRFSSDDPDTTEFYIYLLDPNRFWTDPSSGFTSYPTGYSAGLTMAEYSKYWIKQGAPNVTQHAVIGYRQGLSLDGTKDVMVAVTDVHDAPVRTVWWHASTQSSEDYRYFRSGWALMDGEDNHIDNGGTGYNMMGDWVTSGEKYAYESSGVTAWDDGAYIKAGVPDGERSEGAHDHDVTDKHPHQHGLGELGTPGYILVDNVPGGAYKVQGTDGVRCTSGAIDPDDADCTTNEILDHPTGTSAEEAEPANLRFWPMERLNNSMEGLANMATDVTTFTMTAATDDGYWYGGATHSDTADELQMGHLGANGVVHTFIRFQLVTIPRGKIINVAKVRLSPIATAPSLPVHLKVRAVLQADVAAGDIDTAAECDALTLTDAAVDWDITEWTNGQEYETPNIESVIQEIISQESWASGNALCIVIEDDGSASGDYVRAQSYEEDDTKQRLEVKWHTP